MNTNILAKSKFVAQFGKFFMVGLLNTGIDFLVLNFLMWTTQTYEGKSVILFNTISFSIAVTNSYLLNKYWTFQDKKSGNNTAQFAKFIAISVIGWGLNTSILYSITTYIDPFFGIGRVLWANIAKAAATAAVLAWNFTGYKLFVFKK